MSGEERYFVTRHARPARDKSLEDPVSRQYPDLTEKGVEQTRAKAKGQIADMIRNAPERAVIIIGATSDQPRTKQTAELYGDALAEYQHETKKEDVTVITKQQIEKMVSENARTQDKTEGAFMPGQIMIVVRRIQELIASNPGKKVVIDYPLMVKQLAYKFENRWTDENGNKTEYFSEILKKHNNNHADAGKDWIANGGKLTLDDGRIIYGPLPEKVAKEYLQGIRRLRSFAEKYVGNRPLIVGEVGHQWDMDALITYLASQGKVNKDTFEAVTGGEIAGETEMTEFVLSDRGVHLKYRGKDFAVEGK